jgi:ubiquinone/menaquinone biosynthesis C-methylase UbiE
MMDDLSIADSRLTKSLDQLRVVNRLLGGYSAVYDALFPYMQRNSTRPVRILDVGTGIGDIPAFLLQDTGIRRWDVDLVGIDHNPATVIAARRHLDRSLDPSVSQRIFVHPADAAHLPYADDTFDISMASMFLHHFTSDEAIEIVAEMNRVARDGVLINDLHRHELAYFAIAGLTRILPATEMIRNDAPLSVARGFSRPELYRIARKAGLERVRIRWKWAFRWVLASERI